MRLWKKIVEDWAETIVNLGPAAQVCIGEDHKETDA